LLSAAKGKKEKKAIRHRGVGAPNKGMSRNRSRDSMGLIGPGKTMLRSGPLQGSGAPTSVRTAGLPSMGFLATFGARRFPKGNEGKTQGGLPLGNPVCLWQTELFKLNLKSSPSSSGYNRRRRLATRSSGKQQAERTAVRTAPIVCPEESLLGARRRNPPFPDEGLTRRLRRGWWGCRPEGEVLSFEAKESTKESTRHGDSEGGTRRYALRPSPALCLGLATRFMAFSHFWR